MAHAALIQVKVDVASDRTHRHAILNDYVIPEVSTLPGLQKASWMNDGVGTGTCVAVFDTEAHAVAAVPRLTPSGGPAVISTSVCEVEIEIEI
jgi:hypothetical protein